MRNPRLEKRDASLDLKCIIPLYACLMVLIAFENVRLAAKALSYSVAVCDYIYQLKYVRYTIIV